MCIICPGENSLAQGVVPVCGNTKEKIAMALRQLMSERSFDKITVQNLMDLTQMKRQSFYYHFQDTRDVLMWICRREIFTPLAECDAKLEEWMLLALQLLDRERSFYRKLLKAASIDFLQELAAILEPRILALLYPGRAAAQLSDNQRFVLDFTTDAVCLRIIRFVESRDPMDSANVRSRVEYLIRALCRH